MITTLFFVVAFIAAAVASVAGFGTATITIPFLAWIIGFKQAIILIAFFHGFSNLFKLITLRQSVNVRLMLLYGIPSVLTAIAGAYLLDVIAPEGIGLGIGIFLILFAVYSLVNPSRTLPERNYILVAGGLLSGFTAGLIGMGGAIRGAFLISTKIRREMYIATSAAIALCTDIARITTYVARGNLEPQYYWYIPVIFVIGFAGTRLGVKLLRRLPEPTVKRVVMVMLLLASISFILNYLGIIEMGQG
ncbi:MAG: sulfite exporter TauE/SafE family protein [Chloroflexota bacterium]|nr:sulfite exporter TauE/SafE family protein [Chloroflexota bacterium]